VRGPARILAAVPAGGWAPETPPNWLNLDPMPDLCPQLPDRRVKHRFVVPAGSYLPEAFNRCFQEALRYADWDRLLMLETDMILHQRIVARARTHRADITTGIYFMRRYPPTPVLWKAVSPDGRAINMTHLDMAELLEAPEGEHEFQGAAGTGILSIARHVLELMPRPWFGVSPEAEREGHRGGHDLYFFAQAHRLGFSVAVDNSPLFAAGHIGSHQIDLGNYLAEMKAREET